MVEERPIGKIRLILLLMDLLDQKRANYWFPRVYACILMCGEVSLLGETAGGGERLQYKMP